MRPESTEYEPYFAGYVNQVPEGEITEILESQQFNVRKFWRSIPESAAAVIHPPYTWKIRQVMDHMVDAERIFGYRLLRIARGDVTPLPGFDELHYAVASEEKPAPLADIAESFDSLRRANVLLVRNLPEAAWDRHGTSNGFPISVRALAYILAGHVFHHDKILRKRLVAAPV